MKVVLDTNVLVSGLLFGGVPGRILTAWSTGAIRLVISPPILEEYRRVGLALSKGREPLVGALEALLAMLTVHALLVDAPPLDERVSEDPDDEMFLAAALAANARLIVSGDKHLLRVSGWRGIEVLKARPFVDRYIAPADIKRNVAAGSARRCAAGGRRAGARRPSGRILFDALQQNARRRAAAMSRLKQTNEFVSCLTQQRRGPDATTDHQTPCLHGVARQRESANGSRSRRSMGSMVVDHG